MKLIETTLGGASFELSTGKTFSANRFILGISPDTQAGIFEGYDRAIWGMKFTAAEKREIADYMIKLWDEYGNQGDDDGTD